jgi:predicted GNAT family acetyltransferase
MDITVLDVPERGRFEIRHGESVVGLASYHVDGDAMTLPHTEIDPSMGGRGLGTQLVGAVLDAARARNLHVLPYCSFIRKYLVDHPEDLDLVAEADRAAFGLAPASQS